MTFGIIGAMDPEIDALVAAMEDAVQEQAAGLTFHRGRIAGHNVVVVRCGVGKVCAALCAQLLIDRYQVGCLVSTGIAGGLKPGMAIGDFVVADDAVQHDFDLTPFGYARAHLPVMGGARDLPSRFPADKALTAAFRRAAEKVAAGRFRCHGGTVATGDVFVNHNDMKHALVRDFNAVAAEMEGGAIAQAACINGVPFVLVRAISDLADDETMVDYNAFEEEAADRSAHILLDILRNA